MAGNKVALKYKVVFLMLNVCTHGLNLGLIAGDNKRSGSPLVFKKFTHKAPIFINVHEKPPITPLLPPFPKLHKPPASLSALKLKSDLRKLRSPLTSKSLIPKLPFIPKLILPPLIPLFPKPIIPNLGLIPKTLLPPLIPKLPLLPLIPPLLPPLPLIPILPPPILPFIPSLKLPLIPSVTIPKIPSLKVPLALGSEVIPMTLPCPTDKKDVLTKLRELRKQGLLTTAEFTRFKTLMLRKR